MISGLHSGLNPIVHKSSDVDPFNIMQSVLVKKIIAKLESKKMM